MAVRKGYLCGMYIRTGGSYATPTHTEATLVGDLSVTDPNDKLEATVRGSAGIKEYEPGEMDLMISGRIRVDPDNAVYAAILAAKAAKTALDVMVLNGKKTVNGSAGYRMEMKVFKLDEDQAQGNILFREFELAPCPSDEEKHTVVVSAGAPVFTAISAT